MPDYGQPSSYLVLADGTPVYTSDGTEVGSVAHVLAVVEEDIFDGLVLDTPSGHRFADAPHVQEIFDRAVILALTPEEVERLPEPSENPAAMSVDVDDMAPDGLSDKLKRAWHNISGKH
jgi:hypothetical protein